MGLWRSISGAIWRNRWPCLFLNLLVAGLVWTYYRWPAAAGLWAAVAEAKTRWGYAFSFVATVLAAAVMPYVIHWLSGDLPAEGRARRLWALVAFWGYRGVEIDLMYHVQAALFGAGNDARTLATKVGVDQFIYSTLWAVPTYAVALRWVDCACSWERTKPLLGRDFWRRIYPTILVTNWLIWIPTVALVYSLPGPLQFPLFSVVMCFFVLLVTVLGRGQQSPGSET